MRNQDNLSTKEKIIADYVTFFTDRENPADVYVEYPNADNALVFESVDSKMFEAFLGYKYRKETDEPGAPDFSNLIAANAQDARYRQERCVKIGRRIEGSLGKSHIWYFLADRHHTTMKISANGWEKGTSKKLKFLKRALDEAQVAPIGGGDLMALLRKYVNLSDDDFRLMTVYIVQSFSRSSSHFAAIFSSGKGTGKSTLTKMIRALIDPSKSEAAVFPSTDSDLKTLLGNSYMVCFDNTKAMSENASNILCAAITGSKEAKRKLYTDSDQVVLDLHNLVTINGIDIVPYKSDLAERSLFFELQKIAKADRMTDSEFWGNFKKDRPYILGAIFDTLAKAMALFPDVEEKNLHRMADAHKEMIAIAMALGISQEEFQKILTDNGNKLQAAYLQSNPFVETVVAYINRSRSIDAPAASVYSRLLDSIPGSRRFFPDLPSAFSRKLKEEEDALEQAGIRFSRYKKADANYIRLEKIPQSQQTVEQKKNASKVAELLDNASTEE